MAINQSVADMCFSFVFFFSLALCRFYSTWIFFSLQNCQCEIRRIQFQSAGVRFSFLSCFIRKYFCFSTSFSYHFFSVSFTPHENVKKRWPEREHFGCVFAHGWHVWLWKLLDSVKCNFRPIIGRQFSGLNEQPWPFLPSKVQHKPHRRKSKSKEFRESNTYFFSPFSSFYSTLTAEQQQLRHWLSTTLQ